MMFNTPILDVAVSLIFLYVILSIVVSSLNEILARFISSRGSMLKKAIEEMFDPKWREFCNKSLFDSSAISVLKQGMTADIDPDKPRDHTKGFPSYIPSQAFSRAVVEGLVEDARERSRKAAEAAAVAAVNTADLVISETGNILDAGHQAMNTINEIDWTQITPEQLRIMILDNQYLKGSRAQTRLLLLLTESEGNLAKFKESLESMYDNSMQRVSGWYKRKMQNIITVLAFLITVAFDIDTLHIVNHLWKYPSQAAAMADQATGQIATLEAQVNMLATRQELMDMLDSPNSPSRINSKSSLSNLGASLGTLGRLKNGQPGTATMPTGTPPPTEPIPAQPEMPMPTDTSLYSQPATDPYAPSPADAEFGTIPAGPVMPAVPAAGTLAQEEAAENAQEQFISSQLAEEAGAQATDFDRTGFPIGWASFDELKYTFSALANAHDPQWWLDGKWWPFVSRILGWIATAIAISMGAPFWFDLLNKIVSLRSSMKSA